jgi:hypothetical protein
MADKANMAMTNLSIKNDAVVVVRRWLVNRIKAKFSIIIDAITLGKYVKSTFEVNANDTDNGFNIIAEEERYSCWCVLFIDEEEEEEEVKTEAKIIHKGGGKFKILEDRYGGKYINKIVDASDVIRCTEIP